MHFVSRKYFTHHQQYITRNKSKEGVWTTCERGWPIVDYLFVIRAIQSNGRQKGLE